jgi:hypothetical protein
VLPVSNAFYSAITIPLVSGGASGIGVPDISKCLAATIRAALHPKLVGFYTFVGGCVLAFFANRNHIDFTGVAFGSAATILAFLLPGVGLVGPWISDQMRTSADYVEQLRKRVEAAKAAALQGDADAKAAAAAKVETDNQAYLLAKSGTKSGLDKVLDYAAWLRTGVVCAFVSVPVAAASLVIGAPATHGQSGLDWRAILGSAAVTLLVGTGIGIAPVTWNYLQLKRIRGLVQLAFGDE